MKIEELLKEVDERVDQPMVTPRFGDFWKDHQKKLYDESEIDFDTILDIAWRQGRRAQILEEELRTIYRRFEGPTAPNL